jgi:hypothetical protein
LNFSSREVYNGQEIKVGSSWIHLREGKGEREGKEGRRKECRGHV